MKQAQLEELRNWFENYVAGFYGDDKFVNANIKLKEEHSKRVCSEMEYLADELGLTAEQRRTAEVIALYHDIGRFEQFIKYRTYNDPRSINHSMLGVEILKRTGVLNELAGSERKLIEKAIECHGMKELPNELEGDNLLFCQLIRDADKLDIFHVVIGCYEKYKSNPDEYEFEIEFPDIPECSAEVVESLLQGERIAYKSLRTLNDAMLLWLGWIYDVNFPATLKQIRQRRFLERIVDFLPKTEDIERVSKKIFEYVQHRISDMNGEFSDE